MRKIIQKFISVCVISAFIVSSFIITANAANLEQGLNRDVIESKIITFEDGTKVKETLTRIYDPNDINVYGIYERATYEKTYENSNGVLIAKLTATFSYSVEDKQVSCVLKYGKTYRSDIKEISLTDTGSGRDCTAKYVFEDWFGIRKTISIKCDYKGNANL